MIRQAALYLAHPDDLPAALSVVAGRPVAFRALMAAVRSGLPRVGVPAVFRGSPVARAISATPAARAAVVWLDAEDLSQEPTLLLPATAVVPAASLRPLLAAPGPSVLAESGSGGPPIAVVDLALARTLPPALAEGAPLGERLARMLQEAPAVVVEGAAWCVHVTSPRGAAELEARLAEGLGSPVDTRLDRALHRPLSRRVSRWAVSVGLSPNQVSGLSLVVGLAAAWCFWRGSGPSVLAGVLLYVASVVLDHADGEVARLTLRESRLGEWLDVFLDTVVHAAVVLALGAAAARLAGSGAALGAAAAVGIVASAVVAKCWPPAGEAGVGRALDALGRRDGFYGMLAGFVVALTVRPAALPALMAVVAVGANAYWLGCVGWRLVNTVRNPK